MTEILSSHRSRERILVYGDAGCGKSKGALDIARAGNKLWVIDNDRAWERMLEGPNSELDVSPIDVRSDAFVRDVHPWDVMYEATKGVARTMDPDDWLIIDMMTIAWTWCQGHFSQEVFGADIADYFLDARRRQVDAGRGGGNPFDGMMDWPAIMRMWDRFADCLLNARGHVYMIAESAPIMDAGKIQDKQNVKNLYEALGGKPKGNKGQDYLAQTVLLLGQNIKREWVMTTAKDRERERVERKVWGDFAKDYLVDVAGWKGKAAVLAKRKAAGAR